MMGAHFWCQLVHLKRLFLSFLSRVLGKDSSVIQCTIESVSAKRPHPLSHFPIHGSELLSDLIQDEIPWDKCNWSTNGSR